MAKVKLAELTSFVANNLTKSPKIYLLFGDVGSGKTTFVKHFLKHIGFNEKEITSPTFSLINQYNGPVPIFHLDLYRIKNQSELETINLSEVLNNEEAITIIEWPELLLPIKQTYTRIDFAHNKEEPDCRNISLKVFN